MCKTLQNEIHFVLEQFVCECVQEFLNPKNIMSVTFDIT